jgi:hypothetical protein
VVRGAETARLADKDGRPTMSQKVGGAGKPKIGRSRQYTILEVVKEMVILYPTLC